MKVLILIFRMITLFSNLDLFILKKVRIDEMCLLKLLLFGQNNKIIKYYDTNQIKALKFLFLFMQLVRLTLKKDE